MMTNKIKQWFALTDKGARGILKASVIAFLNYLWNIMSIVVVMLFLLGFILTGGGTGKVLPFGLGGTNWLSALITLYVAVMSLHWLGSLRTPVSEKIFLSNAVCDAFVLGLLILNLGLLNNSSLLMLS